MGDDQKPFHNPFGSLAGLRASLPVPPTPAAGLDATPAVRDAAAPPKGPARAVVRLERAGRGGKEVTVVDHLELPAADSTDG